MVEATGNPNETGDADREERTRLDVDPPMDAARLLRSLRLACDKTGRSMGSIFREILRLQFGANRLKDTEYFKYRLYDDELYPTEKKREFVGKRAIFKLNRSVNKAAEFASLLGHKLYFEGLLRGLGLPGTETLAVYADPASFRSVGRVLALHTLDELTEFLSTADFPLFGKPVGSSLSLGTIGIKGISADKSLLDLTNGATMALEELHAQIRDNYSGIGFMFQKKIVNHPDLAKFTGAAVGTLRVVTCMSPNGLRPLYAAWKIPSKTSMADNFWRSDNMIAQVDVESGELLRCQKSIGVDAEEVEVHPTLGEPLVGMTIPRWREVTDLGVAVASLFPRTRMLGFDIALSETGPVLIECNDNPDHGLYQISAGTGFLTPEHADLIEWNRKATESDLARIKKAGKERHRQHRRDTIQGRLADFHADISDSA